MSWRHRAGSAGAVRRHSGSSGSTLAADPAALVQDKVVQLQQLLLSTRAENQKIKQQLSCLSSLVKRAWLGDKSAVVHVANIVGVAAPEIRHSSHGDTDDFIISVQPKSSVLNNWAKLTIGLLNRQYCHLEREVEDEQRRHFLNRNAYLEEQVERDYVRQTGPDRWEIVQGPGGIQAPASQHVQENTSQPPGGGSGKKKPTVKHLYRPANHKAETGTDPRLTWGDLVPDQNARDGYDRDCLLHKLSSNGGVHSGGGDVSRRKQMDYADPRRYSASGLYDEETALGTDTHYRRPPSGKEQRIADATRSRPKSAILPKGERPLRYETTRPLSTKGRTNPAQSHTSSTADLQNGNHGNRPPSGKKWMKTHTFITNDNEDEHQTNLHLNDLDLKDYHNHGDPDDGWDSQEEDRERRRQEAEAIMVKIKRPEGLVQYEKDLTTMGLMQEDFKNRTRSLQKKLGIPTAGMVQH